ncbi:MAG: acyl-CoA dehydrogenase family protein [Thermoplasmata archaeon]|nr:MAG: acyl-CoA dehydrogenase family protein [Thermoplasmata archaeon]
MNNTNPNREAEKLLRETWARFVDGELVPAAEEIDEKDEFPKDMFKRVADMGAYGIRYPKEYGGSEGTATMFCIMCEELARGSMSVAAFTAMQCLMGTNFIYAHGTDEQKKRLLIPAIKGEKVAAFALTEPDAGTDLMALSSSARLEGDEYVINGTKTWTTNAPYADFFTVLCQTDKSKGAKGLNFFLIEKDTPGLSISPKFEKLGTKGTWTSELAFEDLRIPLENRLGEEGKGLGNLMRILAEIRVMTAALSLGLARAAFDASFRYANERVQFGKPIGRFQAIQMKIATLATDIEASKLLTYNATRMIDRGEKCMKEASMAKYFASETACRAADEATRIFGSYSYSMEYPVQRFFRDTRFLLFGGGTSEILQVIIARELGLGKSK